MLIRYEPAAPIIVRPAGVWNRPGLVKVQSVLAKQRLDYALLSSLKTRPASKADLY